MRLFCNLFFHLLAGSDLSYLIKRVGEVLPLSLFSRLNNTDIICTLKLWYNSFIKLSGPVMRRFETTDSVSLIVRGFF